MHKANSSFSSTFLLRVLPHSIPPIPILLPPARYLADVCLPLHPLSESTSTFCSLRPSISAQHAYSLFSFYRLPLYIVPFNPIPQHPCPLFLSFATHTAYLPFVLLCGTRISLLNLVLQVTILLLSPFPPEVFFLPLFNTFIVSR